MVDRVDISDNYTTDIEQVVNLDPELVLAANVTYTSDIDQLRSAGLPVYQFRTATTIEDIESLTVRTGALVDTCDGANNTVEWMEDSIASITANISDSDPLTYYAQGGGWTAGPGTFQHDIMRTAGLENLAARSGQTGWFQLSDEFVLNENPEWIMYAASHSSPPFLIPSTTRPPFRKRISIPVSSNNVSQPAPTVVYGD
ncbi:MAG: helical backbone metal receptor [Natrialbaceae archaeon]|nr:helical backbone metal receptor [Natrialbaceae archaeon]